MSNIAIPPGSYAAISLGAQDANQQFQSLSALSASIDNHGAGYIAPTGVGQFAIVPNTVAAGQTITVNVTITGVSLNGTVLPSLVYSADLQGPNVTPQAVAVVVVSQSLSSGTPPPDPGSAMIAIPVS